MNKLAVIALGGNALLRGDEKGTIQEQEQNTEDTLRNIVYMLKEGYDIILSHGNGPQVGNILMRNDAGETLYNIPQMPLDICVADSQGGIGYMLERTLRNILIQENIEKEIVTIVTQVLVDKNDPAFTNLTKRVGKQYSKEEADKLTADKGWTFKPSPKADNAWQRVVASPEPLDIMNIKTIKQIARSGNLVIASGGGGIPVYRDEKGMIEPLDAVIDKDKASSLLATKVGADEFYILTDVPYIYKNFRKPDQEILEFLDVADAERYIAEGVFGEGSMSPKVEACVRFVKAGGAKAVITESKKLEDRRYGSRITMHYDK